MKLALLLGALALASGSAFASATTKIEIHLKKYRLRVLREGQAPKEFGFWAGAAAASEACRGPVTFGCPDSAFLKELPKPGLYRLRDAREHYESRRMPDSVYHYSLGFGRGSAIRAPFAHRAVSQGAASKRGPSFTAGDIVLAPAAARELFSLVTSGDLAQTVVEVIN